MRSATDILMSVTEVFSEKDLQQYFEFSREVRGGEMLNEEKQIKGSKYLLSAFIIIGGIIIAGHLLSGSDVSDNGNGTNSTRKQLQQLGTDQQELTGEIREAAAGAGSIAEQAGAVREGMLQVREQAADLNGEIRKSGEIIRESREILATIRSRGATRDRTKD